MQSIGIVESCFKEKFGIPRQPGLVSEALASIIIEPPYDRDEAFIGLADFSHVWVIFIFHQCIKDNWKPTVRPPRLGGNQRMGVFASRSMFRPNPVGLSVVKLEGIRREQKQLKLDISGVDFLDGTPVIDIKPYIPYAENIADATGAYAADVPETVCNIKFTDKALIQCRQNSADYPQLQQLIINLLKTDPRPAYYSDSNKDKEFGMKLLDFDLKWIHAGTEITVLSLDSGQNKSDNQQPE